MASRSRRTPIGTPTARRRAPMGGPARSHAADSRASERQCIAVLEGMEKSRAVAGICTDSSSETQALRRELKRAKKNHEAAMVSNDALRRQVDELRQSAGSQPKVSTHRDRKLMRLFHPDNYTNAPAEVRTKMVEAYRLVSESRPDA